MKHVWMVAVLVCVVLTSSAFAQFTPRQLGMGNTATAIADDGAAWFQNPAGLSNLNVACQENKTWANDVIGFAGDAGDSVFGGTWSGFQPAKGYGFGAGYIDTGSDKFYGGGFGMQLKDSPLSWGATVRHFDYDNVVTLGPPAAVTLGDSGTAFDLGVMYRFARPDMDPIRFGVVVRDLFSERQAGRWIDANNNLVIEPGEVTINEGPFFDLGVAWPVNPQLLLAADITDLTDEIDRTFNFGGEFLFGDQYEWAARAGISDSDLTLGAGYAFANNWRIDAAWADTEGDSTWTVGAGLNF